MNDSIEVLLKFAFIAVLYLFLLWVARSALKDLGRPANQAKAGDGAPGSPILGMQRRDGAGSTARLIAQEGGGLQPGESFVVGSGITIGRAAGIEVHIDD